MAQRKGTKESARWEIAALNSAEQQPSLYRSWREEILLLYDLNVVLFLLSDDGQLCSMV